MCAKMKIIFFAILFLLYCMALKTHCASYNYSDALYKAIVFFEGQRSGKMPSHQKVKWRGDSALSDGKIDNVDLSGGYYDAGDNVKFLWPMSFTITLLSWAAMEYRTLILSQHYLNYLHSNIQWGADLIRRAHTSPTTLYTQVGDGNSDHQCWERPEDMDTTRTLYKITSSSPGSEPAADAAAALASASIVLRGHNKTYASMLLNASQSLFEFANNYRGSYQASCPFYCSYSGYQDELLWAAGWLYRATKQTKYLQFASDNQGWSQPVTEFSWDNKFTGAQILLAKEYLAGKTDLAKYKSNADSFICSLMPGSGSEQVQKTSGGLLFIRDTVNLQYVTGAAFLLFVYSKTLQSAEISGVQCSSAKFTNTQITLFAKSQVDYILGNNPMNISYMVGFGDQFPQHVHHRGSSIPSISELKRKVSCTEGFSSWFSTKDPNPNTHVGAIVGGPNGSDQFDDVRSDSTHLEPTTYMNAAFVGASAATLALQNFLEMPIQQTENYATN